MRSATSNASAPDEGLPVSVKIRERLAAARRRFHANDNIAEFIQPGELEQLLDEVEFWSWDVPICPKRVEVEQLTSLERRHALPSIARDVERGLGPVRKHPQWQEALELLLAGAAR